MLGPRERDLVVAHGDAALKARNLTQALGAYAVGQRVGPADPAPYQRIGLALAAQVEGEVKALNAGSASRTGQSLSLKRASGAFDAAVRRERIRDPLTRFGRGEMKLMSSLAAKGMGRRASQALDAQGRRKVGVKTTVTDRRAERFYKEALEDLTIAYSDRPGIDHQ